MNRKFDDTEEDVLEVCPNDDYYSDSDTGSLRDEDESMDGYVYPDNISYDDVKIRPVLMKRLKIGDAILHVFSNGAIRGDHFADTSYGMLLPGTPYRTYTVECHPNDYKTFFVHELVWQAFHGSPPNGWEVRHKPEYTMFARKMYSNALHHLTTFPTIVTKRI